MARFQGSYDVNVDKKNRFTIPVQFRESLKTPEGERVVLLMYSKSRCIVGYSVSDFNERILKKLEEKPHEDERYNIARRWFIGYSYHLPLDPQGRVVLPQRLKEYAKINSKIEIKGIGGKFEIWAKELAENSLAEAEEPPPAPKAVCEVSNELKI